MSINAAFNAAFNWNQGPRYPTAQEIDLETVMIHEMGHFADPSAPHQRGCPNSPRRPEAVGARPSRAATGRVHGGFLEIFHQLPQGRSRR